MDRINAAFTYLFQGCHCVPAVGHPGSEVGGSRRFIVFICFCYKFWNCNLVRHNVSLCQYIKKEDARSVIPLWRRWGCGPEKFTAAVGMSLKVRGGRKASCSCHSRLSHRSHRPEASRLCRSLLQGDGASDLPLLASNLLLAFHSVWPDGAPIASESFVCWSLGSSDGVFQSSGGASAKARPCPLTSGGTTSRRFQPERKKLTKVEEEIRRTCVSQ